MNQAEYNTQANALLGIIQYHCPNAASQLAAAQSFNALPENWTSKEKLLHLTGVLYDGLAYGNWPK